LIARVIMDIQLKYFASVREAMGCGAEKVHSHARTVGALRDELIARGGAGGEALARGRAVRVALNQTMCDESATLTDGAEVAFFPPVTGG
jgi:molybdopterin synthase sulfur carrier subunit